MIIEDGFLFVFSERFRVTKFLEHNIIDIFNCTAKKCQYFAAVYTSVRCIDSGPTNSGLFSLKYK